MLSSELLTACGYGTHLHAFAKLSYTYVEQAVAIARSKNWMSKRIEGYALIHDYVLRVQQTTKLMRLKPA